MGKRVVSAVQTTLITWAVLWVVDAVFSPGDWFIFVALYVGVIAPVFGLVSAASNDGKESRFRAAGVTSPYVPLYAYLGSAQDGALLRKPTSVVEWAVALVGREQVIVCECDKSLCSSTHDEYWEHLRSELLRIDIASVRGISVGCADPESVAKRRQGELATDFFVNATVGALLGRSTKTLVFDSFVQIWEGDDLATRVHIFGIPEGMASSSAAGGLAKSLMPGPVGFLWDAGEWAREADEANLPSPASETLAEEVARQLDTQIVDRVQSLRLAKQ